MDIDNKFKCVISIGRRCFTEIYLKEMGLKQFSSPFDAVYSKNVDDIIYLLNNKVNLNEVTSTENIKNCTIAKLNNTYGYRTIHNKLNYFNLTTNETSLHTFNSASFPHHNFNDERVINHFNRCFDRFEHIKKCKIRSLFCLFIHPQYSPYDTEIEFNEMNRLAEYLSIDYNCKVLAIVFKVTTNERFSWHIIHNDERLIYININNSSTLYNNNKTSLNEIFEYIGVDKDSLMSYEDFEQTQKS